MTGAHGLDGFGSGFVLADGHLHIFQHTGHHRRGDAEGPDGLAGSYHRPDGAGHLLVDIALRSFEGEVAEVLGHAEAAGHDESIEIFFIKLAQRPYLAAGNAGRLDQHVAAFVHLLSREMVDDMMLGDVGGKDLIDPAVLHDGIEGHGGLVDLGTVINAASRENDCKFFLIFHGRRILSFGHIKVKNFPAV